MTRLAPRSAFFLTMILICIPLAVTVNLAAEQTEITQQSAVEILYEQSVDMQSRLACEVVQQDKLIAKIRPRLRRVRRNLRKKKMLYGRLQRLLYSIDYDVFLLESARLESREPLNGRGCPYKPISE